METLSENSYYKVVTIDKHRTLTSAIIGKNIFFSRTPNLRLYYKLHEWIKPKIGKIFIFDTLIHAKDFMRLDQTREWRIYKCYAKNVTSINKILEPGLSYEEVFRNFWNNKLTRYDEDCYLKDDVWSGTLVADSVMLYEQVRIRNITKAIFLRRLKK